MIKIRPHHLLCLQSFEGMGYNEEFINNMKKQISLIGECSQIELVSNLDDICKCCPLQHNFACSTEGKVRKMDEGILKHFDLEYKIYDYKKLVKKVKSNITKNIFDDICGDCEWHSQTDCYTKIKKEM